MVSRSSLLQAVIVAVVMTFAASAASAASIYESRAVAAEKRLAQALEAIEASGAPTKLSQLYRAPIPDSENAALVYQQAFKVMYEPGDFRQLLPILSATEPTRVRPAYIARARVILAKNARALELIHRAAAMPKCDFRFEWNKGSDLTFPQFARLRMCSRLLAMESAVLLDDGRVDEAVAVCGDNLRLANAANEPRSLIAQLVRDAIIAIAAKSLTATLSASEPAAAACRAVGEEIAADDLAAAFVESIKADRAGGIANFDRVRAAPDPMEAVRQLLGEAGGSIPDAGLPRDPAMVRWWLAADELAYLALTDQAVRQAALPYRDLVRVLPSLADSEKALQAVTPPPVMTAVLAPAYERSAAARDKAIARLGLAQVALLLKAYRAEQGAYPQSLAELPGLNGKPLPTDPFSGKAFCYRPDGAGFIVYSWGPNLKDDGGKPTSSGEPDGGDIVVRCAR